MDTKGKQITFSVSRNLFILGVAIAGAFLVILACIIIRGDYRYQNRGMMRGGHENKWGDRRDMMQGKRSPGGMMGQYPVDVVDATSSLKASSTVGQ